MKLADYLEGLVVMKSLLGLEWTYIETNNTKKLISYLIETPEFEIVLIKPKTEEMILLSILFHNNKHKSAEKILQWTEEHPNLKNTYSKAEYKVHWDLMNIKMTFGVENLKILQEFIDKTF